MHSTSIAASTLAALLLAPTAVASQGGARSGNGPFERIASFPVYLNTDIEVQTVAEIVAATPDGNTLVYTDSQTESVGFVDITDPRNPVAGGVIAVGGEPTSVAVRGRFALVVVNTSVSFVDPSGNLEVVDTVTRTIVRTIPLGGQPDSVAVSPDGRYAAVVIENERDEALGTGEPPQLPAGFVVVADLTGMPQDWTTQTVDLTGIADLFPEDPEPEFVDINEFNVAVITLQENNHIVLIDLASATPILDFPAGSVELTDVDIVEDGLIDQTATLDDVPREPDSVTWTSPSSFATADEGDLFGGSRGFTTFLAFGNTLYEAGNTLEHLAARIGHYPEAWSEQRGNESESIEFGDYGGARYLFVGSERAGFVAVYRLMGSPIFGTANPVHVQVLPSGIGPEGLLAIPDRDLFVVASEVDDRDAKIRSTISIYERNGNGSYPDIESADRAGTKIPIPWGALSALAVSPLSDDLLYTVHDSFYGKSRVYVVDSSQSPARIVRELPLLDTTDVLSNALQRTKYILPNTIDFVPSEILNADDTVNLDIEGIAVEPNGTTFWAVTEGNGNLVGGVSDPMDRPFRCPNLILKLEVSPTGAGLDIVAVVGLPFELTSNQTRFGLEGVTVGDDGAVYICFQREWQAAGDPAGVVRIGRFDPSLGRWGFALYPLDAPTSANGGWVGLSEIANLGGGGFALLERDNQGGPDATIKRIYSIDASTVTFRDVGETLDTFTKTLALDLLSTGVFDDLAVLPFEKLEGLAVNSDGDALIVNDNDGVNYESGETRLIVIRELFD